MSEPRVEPAYDPIRDNMVLQAIASTPSFQRRMRVARWQMTTYYRLFPWMRHPFLHFIQSFWIGLIDEGPRELLKPRWGLITFAWLNDGMKPTVWHTVWGLFHGQDDPYTGIYPNGAPKSRQQAEQWEREEFSEPW